MIENPTLPNGWQSEPLSSNQLLITAPGGMVTVDFERRCFRSGCCESGRPTSEGTYEGRGWQTALVAAAVKWLDAVIR